MLKLHICNVFNEIVNELVSAKKLFIGFAPLMKSIKKNRFSLYFKKYYMYICLLPSFITFVLSNYGTLKNL
jgi:hypothetical protein